MLVFLFAAAREPAKLAKRVSSGCAKAYGKLTISVHQGFYQDLSTHKYQYDATRKLCFGFIFCAENIADLDTGNREYESSDTDKGDGGDDGNL